MRDFSYDALPSRIVFGRGRARTALAAEVGRFGADRVLILATARDEDLVARLTRPFAGRIAATFTAVRPHVPRPVAEAARALAASVRADLVLAVGGGSTVGTAKAIALTTALPILAVPTTYSGSEMTPVWGLTQEGRRTTGVDPRVLPRTVIYDPELTLSLPIDLSGASGLNAMAHCVEAFWAPRRNPISAVIAEEGIRALAAGLPAVASAPTSLPARADLLYGAYLAGAAFAVAGSGLHHKICHVLGGVYDLPHAQTHAVVLPYTLAFNATAAPDATRRISRALGTDDPVETLRDLGRRLAIPAGLWELGLSEEQAEEAAALAADLVPADNPRPAGRAALRELLRTAWAGTALTASGDV